MRYVAAQGQVNITNRYKILNAANVLSQQLAYSQLNKRLEMFPKDIHQQLSTRPPPHT